MNRTSYTSNIKLYLKYLFNELISPLNYGIAFLIGVVINYFQGNPTFSSFVPFVVPIIVQAFSKATVKYSNRHLHLLVKLPAERNDPAFVIENDGSIVLAEGNTKKLFKEKEITCISDIFHGFSLDDISPEQGQTGFEIFSELLNSWYQVKIKPEMESGTCLVWMQNVTELHKAREKAESMALFAKLNPEPVFRCDIKGDIFEANKAFHTSFDFIDLTERNITEFVSQIREINLPEIIRLDKKLTLTEPYGNRIYRFMLSGISNLNVCQVYISDITERVLAEEKISEQNKRITDSIEYAKRIQNAVIPSTKAIEKVSAEHFVLFKPCQIVSGDFYWSKEINEKTIIVAADCTGHGVPGAFMSMLGMAFLNEISNRDECDNTAAILNELRRKVKTTLSQSSEKHGAADGMDISLIIIDHKTNTLQFSGAYNHMLLYRGGTQEVIKADRMPIGKYLSEEKPFTLQERNIIPGDTYYMFSDGFRDQFGGIDNSKYSGKRFKQKLTDIHPLPLSEQHKLLKEDIESWMGDLEQIDDILVIGIKF